MVEFDLIFKRIRVAIHKNTKELIKYEEFRKEELEKYSENYLKELEKFLYHKFQDMINEFKTIQNKYSNENTKMLNEINLLKKERTEISAKISELQNRLFNARSLVGLDNNLDLFDDI